MLPAIVKGTLKVNWKPMLNAIDEGTNISKCKTSPVSDFISKIHELGTSNTEKKSFTCLE